MRPFLYGRSPGHLLWRLRLLPEVKLPPPLLPRGPAWGSGRVGPGLSAVVSSRAAGDSERATQARMRGGVYRTGVGFEARGGARGFPYPGPSSEQPQPWPEAQTPSPRLANFSPSLPGSPTSARRVGGPPWCPLEGQHQPIARHLPRAKRRGRRFHDEGGRLAPPRSTCRSLRQCDQNVLGS